MRLSFLHIEYTLKYPFIYLVQSGREDYRGMDGRRQKYWGSSGREATRCQKQRPRWFSKVTRTIQSQVNCKGPNITAVHWIAGGNKVEPSILPNRTLKFSFPKADLKAVMVDFPGGLVGKNLPSAGDTSSTPGQGTKIVCAAGQLSLHATMKTQNSQK